MSPILLTAIVLNIVLMMVVVFFWSRAISQDATRDEFEIIRNQYRALMTLAYKWKEQSLPIDDVEKEIDRNAAHASKMLVAYASDAKHSNQLSWCAAIIAIGVLVVSLIFNAYVDDAVQQAYKRGAVEALQKAQQAVQEAVNVD